MVAVRTNQKIAIVATESAFVDKLIPLR